MHNTYAPFRCNLQLTSESCSASATAPAAPWHRWLALCRWCTREHPRLTAYAAPHRLPPLLPYELSPVWDDEWKLKAGTIERTRVRGARARCVMSAACERGERSRLCELVDLDPKQLSALCSLLRGTFAPRELLLLPASPVPRVYHSHVPTPPPSSKQMSVGIGWLRASITCRIMLHTLVKAMCLSYTLVSDGLRGARIHPEDIFLTSG